MSNRDAYYDFGVNFIKKIRNDMNVSAKFEIYPDIDAVIIKTYWKGFTFDFPIDCIPDHIFSNDIDDLYERFVTEYKEALQKCFFKSDEKKAYNERRRLGGV